ncbi:Chondroitin synthase [Methylobacterium bullatum]|uniref:Chondroitin synthase n=1 Tax=Methylobacterium bullatum TaxID=570505 RepID=A0A679J6A8_9HYPH|nr:Chondroitin synthase [Methylobacterium bullatum]
MHTTVIIPYYNHGMYLHAAVQSCLYSGSEVEIIIINDGSKERHADSYIAKAAALSTSVQVVHKQNGGLSSARNAGISSATGELIQFLDSDDVLVPGKLRMQERQLIHNPDMIASVCGYALSDHHMSVVDRAGDSISPYKLDLESIAFRWERGLSIPIHCGLFRRAVFSDIRFDETVHGKEDWIFWANLLSKFDDCVCYLPFLGAIYRQHDRAMTKLANEMAESWAVASNIIAPTISKKFPDFQHESDRWHQHFYRGLRSASARPSVSARRSEPRFHKYRPQINSVIDLKNYECIQSNSYQSDPLITFVVPVYNHAEHLVACLDSLKFDDSDVRYEIVVVDDCSPDPRVLEVLHNRTSGSRISIFRGKANYGISQTQNAAAQFARGTYLAFVDCDDFLAPDALSIIASAIRDNHSVDYFFTDRIDVDEQGNFIRVAKYGGYKWIRPSGDIARDLMFGMVASHLKVIKRDVYLAANGCNPLFSGVQDWDLALRLSLDATFSYIPHAVYNHRIHAGSVTSSIRLGQMAQSNELRHRVILKKFQRSAVAADVFVSWFDGHQTLFDIVDVISDDFRIVFRQKCELPLEQLEFLREFNGFFDRLELTSLVATQLMGFLGGQDIRIISPVFD